MTEYFFIYNLTSGMEAWRGSGEPGSAVGLVLPSEFRAVIVSQADWQNISLAEIPVARAQGYIWDMVKTKRDAVIDGGAASAIGMVDSDALSRSNISGAALGALIAQSASAPFSMEWTAKDNSVHTLDAAQMIALGLAVLSHVNAAHDNARALRAEIEAAAAVTELLTIDISAGWP